MTHFGGKPVTAEDRFRAQQVRDREAYVRRMEQRAEREAADRAEDFQYTQEGVRLANELSRERNRANHNRSPAERALAADRIPGIERDLRELGFKVPSGQSFDRGNSYGLGRPSGSWRLDDAVGASSKSDPALEAMIARRLREPPSNARGRRLVNHGHGRTRTPRSTGVRNAKAVVTRNLELPCASNLTETRSGGPAAGPILEGYFSTFESPYEISSAFEGNFVEQVAPGAFRKTMRESSDKIVAMVGHGHEAAAGEKPIGDILELTEDEVGAFYRVALFDEATYVRDLLPALRAGIYSSSFKFRVLQEKIEDEPEPSEANPNGLPLRTIQEARLFEFGPVVYPANPEATAELVEG